MLVPSNGHWQNEDEQGFPRRSTNTKWNDTNTDRFLGGDMQLFNAKDRSNWLRVFVMILYDFP
jgi:hypothetical protein